MPQQNTTTGGTAARPAVPAIGKVIALRPGQNVKELGDGKVEITIDGVTIRGHRENGQIIRDS